MNTKVSHWAALGAEQAGLSLTRSQTSKDRFSHGVAHLWQVILFFRMMGGEAKQNSVFKTMILFSLAMLFLPVFLYFFSKSVFFEGEF